MIHIHWVHAMMMVASCGAHLINRDLGPDGSKYVRKWEVLGLQLIRQMGRAAEAQFPPNTQQLLIIRRGSPSRCKNKEIYRENVSITRLVHVS
jgi:hypothetical protein